MGAEIFSRAAMRGPAACLFHQRNSLRPADHHVRVELAVKCGQPPAMCHRQPQQVDVAHLRLGAFAPAQPQDGEERRGGPLAGGLVATLVAFAIAGGLALVARNRLAKP